MTKWVLYAIMNITAPLTPVQLFNSEARCVMTAELVSHDYDKLPAWKRPMLFCLPRMMTAPAA